MMRQILQFLQYIMLASSLDDCSNPFAWVPSSCVFISKSYRLFPRLHTANFSCSPATFLSSS